MPQHPRNRTHPAHRRPVVLVTAAVVALAGLIALGPASAPFAAQEVHGGWTTAAGPHIRPTTVALDAVSVGEPIGWRDAARLLTLPSPAPQGPQVPRAGAGGPAGAAEATYRPPVPDAVIRATFDPPDAPWARGHRGVDLEARVGAQVLAPATGVVRFVGTVVDRGVVTVEHPDGLRSSVEPVLGQVEVGARVQAGQVLGTVQAGGSHCTGTPCVHWGVRRGTTYLNPLDLLPGNAPIVLLPVPES